MEKSSFFDAEIVNGEYDRVYLSEDYARYFSSFIGNGVFPNPSDNLKVIANGDTMKVIVKAGKAWINGYYYENDSDLILNIEPADGVLHRIDRVVLRLDLVEREITVKIKQGGFSSNPVAQNIERNVDVYELALADIRIQNGVISIVNSDINDLRLDTDLCGIVHGVVEQVDTTEIFNTYQQYLNEKLNSNEFNEWFMSLKNKLDPYEDLALQLQLQISELEEKMQNSLKTDGTLQENLNVDMLDGKHAADFIEKGVSQAELKSIELSDTNPYIDFHFNNSTSDYTSRIIESSSGTLTVSNNLKVSGKLNDKTISGTLVTNEKTNIITAINEVFTNASNGKSSIANAVTGKGVSANSSMTFDQLANAIGNISLSSLGGYMIANGTAQVDGTSGDTGNRFYISTIDFPFNEVKFFACTGTAKIASSPTTSNITYSVWCVYSADIDTCTNYSYQKGVEKTSWDKNKIPVCDTSIGEVCNSSSVNWYAVGI